MAKLCTYFSNRVCCSRWAKALLSALFWGSLPSLTFQSCKHSTAHLMQTDQRVTCAPSMPLTTAFLSCACETCLCWVSLGRHLLRLCVSHADKLRRISTDAVASGAAVFVHTQHDELCRCIIRICCTFHSTLVDFYYKCTLQHLAGECFAAIDIKQSCALDSERGVKDVSTCWADLPPGAGILHCLCQQGLEGSHSVIVGSFPLALGCLSFCSPSASFPLSYCCSFLCFGLISFLSSSGICKIYVLL